MRGSGAWTATATSPVTVTPINFTSPRVGVLWMAGSAQTIAWTVNPAYTRGQFLVGIVNAGGSTSYINKYVAVTSGARSYSVPISVSCPPGSGYRAFVSWRPLPLGSWQVNAQSSVFTVTAPGSARD
jgi:hypothetical protein